MKVFWKWLFLAHFFCLFFLVQLVQDFVRAVPAFTTPELIWEVNQLSVSV